MNVLVSRIPSPWRRRLIYWHFLASVYGFRRGTTTACWSAPCILDHAALRDLSGPRAYPIDFSEDAHPKVPVDDSGIPIVDYANLGRQYNPWFVGHVALGCYSRWRRSNAPDDLERFRKLADWLVATAVVCDAGVKWLYHFDWFGTSPPWFSGLSQAHAISVLLRAAHIDPSAEYADLARGACEVMVAPVSAGGTAWEHTDGTISFEEAPATPPSSVLNGHLFSVFALRDALHFFSEPRYADLLTQAIRFVRERIDAYDLGYWTRYSLHRMPFGLPDIASSHYHAVHIGQLRVLEAISGNSLFGQIAHRFEGYQQSIVSRQKALWVKRFAKLIR